MTASHCDDNSHRPLQTSTNDNSVIADRHGHVFSWTRTLKVLSCVLSVLWLIILHVSTANSGGFTHATCRGKAVITIGTIIAIFPMFFLRGRWIFALALPFAFVAVLTLWACWTSWGWL